MLSISGLEDSGEIDWTHKEASCEPYKCVQCFQDRQHFFSLHPAAYDVCVKGKHRHSYTAHTQFTQWMCKS